MRTVLEIVGGVVGGGLVLVILLFAARGVADWLDERDERPKEQEHE